jgi:hypothetical protein
VKKRLKKSQNLFNDLAIMTVGILKIAIVYGPLYYKERSSTHLWIDLQIFGFPKRCCTPVYEGVMSYTSGNVSK